MTEGGGGGENRTISWLRFSWRQVAPPEGFLLGLAPRSKNAAQPLLLVKKPLFDRPTLAPITSDMTMASEEVEAEVLDDLERYLILEPAG